MYQTRENIHVTRFEKNYDSYLEADASRSARTIPTFRPLSGDIDSLR